MRHQPLSPAHQAVADHDLNRLRDLLDNGHDVENDNGDGWSLLRRAIHAEADQHTRTGESLLGDRADLLRGQFGAVYLVQVVQDVAHRHAVRVQVMIMSSRPPATRPDRFGTSTGSKVPALSRGTERRTGPRPVCTVFRQCHCGNYRCSFPQDCVYRNPGARKARLPGHAREQL